MTIIDDLLAPLTDASVLDVRVGASWTAVVVEQEGQPRCGLASSLRNQGKRHGHPNVRDAGRLTGKSGLELARLARSASPPERSIGLAAINALLPRDEAAWTDINAGQVIAEQGRGKKVALVGHFPFASWLREQVAELWVLELQPQGDDLPAEAAPDIIPQADVLALTSMTLLNDTFDRLMRLRRADALTVLLGPTTPLSPLLFDHGVDLLSGAVVEDVEATLRAVSQGAGFRQVHRQGVRLVTMQRGQGVNVKVVPA